MTTVMKFLVAGMVALVLILAAFGVGVSVGVGQGRGLTAAAAPVEQAALAEPDAAAEMGPTPAEMVAQVTRAATATPAAPKSTTTPGATPSRTPFPTPTRQDKSTLPDEAPIDTELLNEAWKLLKEQYYGNLPEGEDVTYAAIRGILSALGDKHTAFLDPEQAESSNMQMEGEFEGIGAGVESAPGGGVLIRHLYDGQPAQKAGIEVGDVVMKVDGRDITMMDLNEAVSLIRGKRGTDVTLTIKRGDQKPFDITVTRARIEIPIVTAETLADGKIEYIALSEFSNFSTERIQQALESAAKKKPQGIILDLRDNPGGLLDAAVRIGSMFVPDGNVVIERFSDGRQEDYRRQGRYLLNDIPLVVLVNGGSASASEIVAGAIQDAGTGVLMGTTTYGKGSVQLPNSMSNGSQLRITIARWYTPKDRGIDGVGLSPDIEVPDATAEQAQADEDPQLDRAIEYLLTGK
ncbi:MAG: S41 family peptidase [Anaerolineae bacterium]|nr:S41 family peptidase [Anaerolineae bacterium]